LNFIQLYIRYIGASRAYGVHFELMDFALFLTNQGITIYLGHKHRWSRKWHIKAPTPAMSTPPHAQPSKIRTPGRVAAAASGAFASAAQALASPVVELPTYTPMISVVPVMKGNSKNLAQPPAITAPRRDSKANAVESASPSEKAKVPVAV
jgi:hypothetical protein